jgi:hypothetical protein
MQLAAKSLDLGLPLQADHGSEGEFDGLTLRLGAGDPERFVHQRIVDNDVGPHGGHPDVYEIN